MRFPIRQTYLATILATLGLLGSACRMHREIVPPESDVPLQWPAQRSNGIERNLPVDPWWQSLGSSELDSLVEESLATNRQVRMAINSVEQAQAHLDTIRLGWLPSLNFFGGAIDGNTTLFFQGMPIPVSNVGGFVGFLPTYIINLFQHGALNQQADRVVAVSQAEYLAVRVAVISQTVTAYATLLASQRQGEIICDLRKNLEARASLAEAMNARGLGAKIKHNQLQGELHLLEGQASTNEANTQAAQNALLSLVGRPIGRIKPTSSLEQLKTTHVIPGNTPAAVIGTRPDVAAARARVDALNYGVTAAATALLPSINLSALMTNIKSTTNDDSNSSSANFQAAFANWVLAPEMIGSISSSDARYKGAAIAYVEAVNNALRETDDALASFVAVTNKLGQDVQAGRKMEENVTLSRAMAKRGILSEEQYLNVRVENDLVQAAIAQTRLSQLIALAKLYQSMGGGSLHGEKGISISNERVFEIE